MSSHTTKIFSSFSHIHTRGVDKTRNKIVEISLTALQLQCGSSTCDLLNQKEQWRWSACSMFMFSGSCVYIIRKTFWLLKFELTNFCDARCSEWKINWFAPKNSVAPPKPHIFGIFIENEKNPIALIRNSHWTANENERAGAFLFQFRRSFSTISAKSFRTSFLSS